MRTAFAVFTLPLFAANGAEPANQATTHLPVAALIANLPHPATTPLSGSEFVRLVSDMNPRQREREILNAIVAGNVPGFLKDLVPVTLRYRPGTGKEVEATIFAMPEYVAIGSDRDFIRIPMNLYTASAVASRLGLTLPTRKIVDAIYRSASHFSPEPMTPGPQMRSTEYYRIHNERIDSQGRMLGIMPGSLVAGHKKDVVLTPLLDRNPGRIAIYGWHRLTGVPIQPLSTVHGACYADYSHGIRLISETVLVNGNARSIYDLLKDPVLANLVSDEGPFPNARETMKRLATGNDCDSVQPIG